MQARVNAATTLQAIICRRRHSIAASGCSATFSGMTPPRERTGGEFNEELCTRSEMVSAPAASDLARPPRRWQWGIYNPRRKAVREIMVGFVPKSGRGLLIWEVC